MRIGLAILIGAISFGAGCNRPNPDAPAETVTGVDSEPSTKQEPPTLTIENNEILGGVFITVEAETVISNQRPELVLVCGGHRAPSFQLYLKQTPASPPPLRGVYGTFVIDNGPPQSIELAWTTRDGWLPRDENRTQAAGIVRRFIRGRRLRLLPPPRYGSGQPIDWDASVFAARRGEIQRSCGA